MMRSLALTLLLALAFGLAGLRALAGPPVISGAQAAQYLGQEVEVEGVVASVFVSRGGTVFLNLDRPHPHQSCTGVIFAHGKSEGLAVETGFLRQLEGHRVRLSGTLTLYRDRPQIRLTDAHQITDLTAAPATAPAPEGPREN